MTQLFARWLKLRSMGVLGINQRNAGAILIYNPRALFPQVDDKLRMAQLCERIGVPTPAVLAVFSDHRDLANLPETLAATSDCVLKPVRGSSGRGVLILTGESGKGYRRHNGSSISLNELNRHCSDVLSGMYSLGGRPDRVIVQKRVSVHPEFERISYRGTPDIRVLVYRGEIALAMLRLPTLESNGRANLHQGGVGVGLNLSIGSTTRAIWHRRRIDRHPDTGEPLGGRGIPYWSEILSMSRQVARATGLGFLGVDIVLETTGPLLLEANARPGLAIQSANGVGLGPILKRIDAQLERLTT